MAAKKDEQLKDVPLNVPAPMPDREDHEEQARLLAEYRVSGINRGYIDQSRDQEPDIAAEFGVAPHPELFNPVPHEDAGESGSGGVVAGIGEKQPEGNLLVNPDEERAEELRDAAVERALAREAVPSVPAGLAGAQPVVVVDDRSEEMQKLREEQADAAEKAAKDSKDK